MSLRLRQTQGYTIDQTILIVAIIAILVTLIIITVGWNLINKASGTKLASQFRQVEDANGQFYAAYRTWPHLSYTAPAANADGNILAIAGVNGTLTFRTQVSSAPDFPKNFIPGFRQTAGTTRHNFGSGGTIQMLQLTNPFGSNGDYLVIQFNQVPFSEVQQAERAIDGEGNESYTAGRVVASTGNCLTAAPAGVNAATGTSTLVNACYAANLVQ